MLKKKMAAKGNKETPKQRVNQMEQKVQEDE